MIRIIEADGWRFQSQRGSHRQYKHPTKSARVTVPGHPGDDLHPRLEGSIRRQAPIPEENCGKMRCTVIIEKSENNYGAWVPDLPGCVTTGPTVGETLSNMQEAIEFHLDGLREDGEPIPEPRTVAAVVEIAA